MRREHAHFVRQKNRFLNVVCNKDYGLVGLAPYFKQIYVKFLSGEFIKCRERLIYKKYFRPDGKRPCYAVICAKDHSYILQHDFGVCHDNPSFLSKMKSDRQNRPVIDAFVCRFINYVPIINLRYSSVNMFSYICYFDTKTYGSKCARAQHSH